MADDASHDLVEARIREIMFPNMAFLMANDLEALHLPDPHLIAEYGNYLWGILTTGVAGLVLKEAVKGAAGEFGKGLGKALFDRVKTWMGGAPGEPAKEERADEAVTRAQLAETTALLKEVLAHLLADEQARALEAGAADVTATLIARGFPRARATELAADFRELAAAQRVG